jgi:hypothetical protein
MDRWKGINEEIHFYESKPWLLSFLAGEFLLFGLQKVVENLMLKGLEL